MLIWKKFKFNDVFFVAKIDIERTPIICRRFEILKSNVKRTGPLTSQLVFRKLQLLLSYFL